MKLFPFKIILLFIAFSSVYAMCSKEDADPDTNNPNTIQIKKGFLVTIGINGIYAQDSICIRNGSSGGTFNITDYSWTAAAGSFIERPRDIWEVTSTGTNHWHFRNNAGRYLGYDANGSINLDVSPGPDNLFIMNSSDNKFYIQPVSNPSVYLNTVAWDVQPPDSRHHTLRFRSTKQLWWFMP